MDIKTAGLVFAVVMGVALLWTLVKGLKSYFND